ncbi:GPO family capsid scaffolding protein [Novosphingobium beihaiensis]|uniref:GPO family capsid scaffolding protein n=1 Tax=Novosphingobium beihaiensis TaxID=2930389 RepID=A0ABT0BVP7_9SPHN|nr:GPO family capsid scaffolding protein [Novosphingobium beihaiensis]MCJ2189155.1 GPO family capsid scaffolding protein [Novosphingobium beihaiensis]
MADPRFFRVAVEGDTTDGRKITRQDILDCAETFNPQLYGVRVNLEHFRGVVPDGPFDMLGDVVSVKAEEIDIPVGSITQKAMALFAAIKPLPALVEINKKKQKIFSSIEIGQNCRGTGKAYLVGLATTDSPASFGTQALEFAAKTPGFLSNRKLSADNLICQAYEIPQEVFAAGQADRTDPDPTGIFASFRGLLEKLTGQAAVQPKQEAEAEPAAPQADGNALAAFGVMMGQLASAVEASNAATASQVAKLSGDFASLKAQVENTPAGTFTQRLPATGGENAAKTDC